MTTLALVICRDELFNIVVETHYRAGIYETVVFAASLIEGAVVREYKNRTDAARGHEDIINEMVRRHDLG